jgi:serine/threonine-protein kinase
MRNPAALPEGAVFQGRYQIIRCISAGGMGAIYECEHLSTQKRRALKVMLPQVVAAKGMRERFELEARITAKIESDHIVETFDAGIDPETGAPFIVMELLRGEDVHTILEAHGPFAPASAIVMLSQLALALDRTHAGGIVHRDLKPQNLFLTARDDGSPRLKVLDFGIAKVVADGNKTALETAAIGTPLYMSPEQTTGDGTIGPPADLYALAHIAYTLLVGHAYWLEEQQSLPMFAFLSRAIAGAAEPPSARAARAGRRLPVAFDAWFARATARDPAARFDRASTQIAELATALGTAPPQQLLGTPPAIHQRGSLPDYDGGSAAPPGGSGSVVAAATGPRTGGTTGAVLADPVAPGPPSRTPLVLLAAGVGVAALAVGAIVVLRPGGSGSGNLASAPAPSAAQSAVAVPPAVEAAPSDAAAPESPSSAVAAAPLPASASASATPAAPIRQSKPPEAARPTGAAKPAPVAPRSCDPPYTVDAAGHHHPKPECM